MNNEYLKRMDALRQASNVKLQKQQEQAIRNIYDKAFEQCYEDLINMEFDGSDKKAIAAKVAYTQQLYNNLETVYNKYSTAISQTSAEYHKAFMQDFLKPYESDKFFQEYSKKVQLNTAKTVDMVMSGKLYSQKKKGKDGKFHETLIGLDDRLWNVANNAGDKISDAIASCVAQGMSSIEMAQNLKQYAKGGHRTWDRAKIREKLGSSYASKYGGSLDYEALRLARTTNTHIAQLSVINGKEVNPYLSKVRYRAAHSAGRTCSTCLARDGQLYSVNTVPFDHPNGMCHLEPVFCINGKIATAEEIGEDIGNWVRGEKNSGMMDRIKDYKDLEPYKPKIKLDDDEEEDDVPQGKNVVQQYQDRLNELVSGMDKNSREYYANSQMLLYDFPPHMQQAYKVTLDYMKTITDKEGKGAYYQGGSRLINLIVKDKQKQSKQTGRGLYDVWFHESGHAMDDILARRLGRNKVLSANKKYINALKRDFDNHKVLLKRKYLIEQQGAKAKNYTDDQVDKMIEDKHMLTLYKRYLAKDDRTAGIQDVIEGLSNCEYHIRWGHGKAYWNRRNRDEEVSSEAWANMLGSYSDDDTYDYMKEYFPEALEEQNKILQSVVQQLQEEGWL